MKCISAAGAHVSLVAAGLEDELLWLVVPVLNRGVRRSQARGSQGQARLSVPILIPLLDAEDDQKWRNGQIDVQREKERRMKGRGNERIL